MFHNSFLNIDMTPQIPVNKQASPPERRNLSISDIYFTKMQSISYQDYTVKKTTDEAYKKNAWVFRCVNIKASAFASVQYYVERDGERIEGHPIERLLAFPNPQTPAQDSKQLISMWLNLNGEAMWKKAKGGGRTTELWLISPDIIRPKVSNNPEENIVGYVNPNNPETIIYQPEEIIHFKFLDPANPTKGVSPLQSVGKTVDSDVLQNDYNASAAASHGVLDGIISIDREYVDPDDTDLVQKEFDRIIQGQRRSMVVGSNVKYQQLSVTPKEMDFIETRKANRDEIAVAYGVPLPLLSNDASTYNNFNIANLILWTQTIIPEIDDFISTLNHAFQDELNENEKIVADLAKVPALRQATFDQVETAQKLYDMGVPFENINRLFEIGVDEFPGWDQSQPKNAMSQQQPEAEERQEKKLYTLVETRETADQKADKLYAYSDKKYKPKLAKLLDRQKKKVLSAMERGKKDRKTFDGIVKNDRKLWDKELTDIYLETGVKFGEEIALEKREIEDDLTAALEEYLEQEQWILEDISLIESDTVTLIIEKIKKSIEENWTIAELQQSIIDAGIFEDSRALRIARTTAGTSASIGELESAKQTGATHKTWLASNKETRKQHKNRNGETVKIDQRYSKQFPGKAPRYPLDHQADASDRINCRCSQSFSIRD